MLRTFDIILFVAMVAAATVTYQIKHHAENKLAEVRRLRAEVHLEKQTIDLLEADWSLLNQPGRVQHLVESFKELIAGGPEAFTDPTITGSVLQ